MLKLFRLLLLILLSLAVSPAYAFNDPETPAVININSGEEETGVTRAISSGEEIKAALISWAEAMGTGSSSAVAALYADNAILIPTLSPQILTTPEARKAYFDKLTAHKNLKVQLQQAQLRAYEGVALASGLYTFSYTEHGKPVVIPARFSFVYRKTDDGRLVIVEHHSSKLPKG